MFINTRSITSGYTYSITRALYADFPSSDPTVRLVLLLTIFCGDNTPNLPSSLAATTKDNPNIGTYITQCKEKIESIGIGPVTRDDLRNVLLNKFVPERFVGVLEYGREVLQLSKSELEDLVREVAFGCLEIGCKGKMLKKLVDTYEHLSDEVAMFLLRNYRLSLEDLPYLTEGGANEKACRDYEAPLCTEFISAKKAFGQFIAAAAAVASGSTSGNATGVSVGSGQGGMINNSHGVSSGGEHVAQESDSMMVDGDADESGEEDLVSLCSVGFCGHTRAYTESGIIIFAIDLVQGYIGQDTLTSMIRKDELAPSRRRRYYDIYTPYHDNMGKITYPAGMS